MRTPISIRLFAAGTMVFALATFSTTRVAAQCDVDQSNIAAPTINFATVFSGEQFGQTFTVAQGGLLCNVAMYVDKRGTPAANLVAGVQNVSGGLPNGNVLATASLSPAGVTNGLNIFDVSAAGLAVNAGDTFAIVLSSTATIGNDYLARAVSGNLYAAGQAVVNPGSGWATFGPGFDAIFRTEISPVGITGIKQIGNDIRITWKTIAGKSNVVQSTSGSLGGSYTNNFTDLSANIVVPGSGPITTNYLDVGGATNVPARYYRVRLVP